MAAHSPASAVANTTSSSRLATNCGLERIGDDGGERLGGQPNGAPHIDGALVEFSRQDIAKFVEQRSRRNRVLTDAMLQEIAADAARDQTRDEHVRVQQELHETRLNTSSSVKMP